MREIEEINLGVNLTDGGGGVWGIQQNGSIDGGSSAATIRPRMVWTTASTTKTSVKPPDVRDQKTA